MGGAVLQSFSFLCSSTNLSLFADFKTISHSLDDFDLGQDQCLEKFECKFGLIFNMLFSQEFVQVNTKFGAAHLSTCGF